MEKGPFIWSIIKSAIREVKSVELQESSEPDQLRARDISLRVRSALMAKGWGEVLGKSPQDAGINANAGPPQDELTLSRLQQDIREIVSGWRMKF